MAEGNSQNGNDRAREGAADGRGASDDRVYVLLADYDRMARGSGAPSRAEFIAAHPQHAAELAAHFDNEDAFRVCAIDGSGSRPSWANPSEPPAVPGRRFGAFDVIEELGRGGMGIVFKARQSRPERIVALKLLPGGAHGPATVRERFRREAEIAAALEHRNIVRIFEVGEVDGHPYFAMPVLEGGTLTSRLRGLRSDPRALAGLLSTLARAVHFAHEHGVLHRDLKPSNVLFDAHGQPHVTDFGLSKRPGKEESLTNTGDALGTLRYMAPEQALGRGTAISLRSDVYSLGAILYEALAGHVPFKEASGIELYRRVVETPLALSPLPGDTPLDLGTICRKCIDESPHRRYATAQELAQDLERFAVGEPIAARPATRTERAVKWARRRPAQAALLVVSFAAMVSITGLSLWYARQISRETRRQVDSADLRTYESRITSAFESLSAGSYVNAFDLADSTKPVKGSRDWRGIEWRILQRWIHPEHWEIRGNGISTAALSDDGVLLAVQREGGSGLELRDARSGKYLRELVQFHGGAGRGKWCFTPDSRCLAVAAPDGLHDFKVSLLSVSDGEVLWQVAGTYQVSTVDNPAGHRWVAISPNGRWVVVLIDGSPTTVYLAASGVKACPNLPLAVRVAFSPDSAFLLLTESVNPVAVSIHETGAWTLVERRAAPSSVWVDSVFAPSGALFAATSPSEGRVGFRAIGSAWEEVLPPLQVSSLGLITAAWAPGGEEILLSTMNSSRSEYLSVIHDVRSGRRLGETAHQLRPFDWAAYLPNGSHFLTMGTASGATDGSVKHWARGAMTYPLHLPPRGPENVETAISEDGKYTFAAWSDNSVERWRLSEEGAVLDGLFPPSLGRVHGFNVSPDGSRFAAAEPGGDLHVWDLDRFFAGTPPDLCLEARLPEHTGSLCQPTFTLDGKYLVCGEDSAENHPGNIVVWRRAAGTNGDPWVFDARFSAPGLVKLLASSNDSRWVAASNYYAYWVRLLDLKERSVSKLASSFGQNVQSLAFSPGTEYLAAARNDGNIAVWILADVDPAIEQPPHLVLERHEPSASLVLFSADGSRLVSGGHDRALRFWIVGDPHEPGGWPLAGVIRGLSFVPETGCFSRDSRWLVVAGGPRDDHSADGVHIFPISRPPAELEPVDGLRRW